MQKTPSHPARTLIVTLAVFLLGLFLYATCLVLHSGQDRVKLHVRTTTNETIPIYLKSNGHIVTISHSPKMRLIGEQDNVLVAYDLILYRNTADTLHIVYFVADTLIPQPPASGAIIHCIHEQGYNPQLIKHYQSKGYSIFPPKRYI